MSSSFTQSSVQARSARVLRTAGGVLALAALPAASAQVQAVGLEPLAVAASRLLGREAVVAAAKPAEAATVTQRQPGLVSQDHVKIDLTALSLSAFGDADEPTQR